MSLSNLSTRFSSFADWCVDTSPLYERLSRGVADDDELLALAAEAPGDRSPPHLLFASAQYLLFDGADHPLAAYYPSVTDDPADGDPFPDFREFCLEYEEEIRTLLRSRRTQTNAVRRTAALLPAFERVSRRVDGEPLALVEVGPSAGLNLAWDRYAYDYGEAGRHGPPDADVVIDSALRGDRTPPFPESFPSVHSRVGIDLNPLDVTNPEDVNWLRALVWPEHGDRQELLRRAARATARDPPRLVAGDAVEALPEVVDDIPEDVPVCVFDTQVRYQFTAEMRAAFDDAVASLAAERELHSLSGDEAVPDEEAIYLTHTTFDGGVPRSEKIAAYQQHGRWLRWLAEEE
jgi:hypothetical protein